MRATFLSMLAVSLAVHGLIAGGVALSSCWGSAQAIPPRIEKAFTLSLIYPKPKPVKPTSAPPAMKRSLTRVLATSTPAMLSQPALPAPPRTITPVTKPALPVLAKTEPNPNAHLPPPSPDAVLAPVPAPRLDGTKGVVFILDVSGSMYEPYSGATRLAFARADLSQRVRSLPDGTPFAVVLYAKTARASGPLVAANAATREAAVRFLMRDVNCDGGTNLPTGLVAARALNTGALVLATDGDLNISCTDLMLQAQKILGEAGTCPSMLILGIAPRQDTTDEHLLQDLAGLEGGTYTYEEGGDVTALR
ncbi:MAG TPA: VWA domain-containing protein [Candidatus Methylacidiphilales bacterium]|nr:VWA domain-containing protein [Candidatus Methylacidiphilales bacterium]